MTTENGIEVRNLVVRYDTTDGPLTALDCTALSLAAGSSTAIIGPSGCGKSTLLCMMAGLALPSSGSVQVGATTLTDLSEKSRVAFRKRKVGMVFQADNLLPFLTVAQNIRLQLVLCAVRQGAEARTRELIEQLGLEALSDRLPDQLSGGQRSRVAVARAVVHVPLVILADEPTGALDKGNADRVVQMLQTVQHSLGATLVIVTHDASIAARMDRQVTLRQGRIVADNGVQNAV